MISRILRRIRALIQPAAIDRALSYEVHQHIELETADLITGRAA
jgi:hypothetical protein